jgi:hypothetical protein
VVDLEPGLTVHVEGEDGEPVAQVAGCIDHAAADGHAGEPLADAVELPH